mgnify:CR=1 FL=1
MDKDIEINEAIERATEGALASSAGYAALLELTEILTRARNRGCAEQPYEIKWLIELPLTNEEKKRLDEITGWFCS